MCRIELTDSDLDIFTKMSEGNSGALTAMVELYEKAPKIDPQSALGPFGPILSLDTTHGIYGSSIDTSDLHLKKCSYIATHFTVITIDFFHIEVFS